MDPLDGTTNFAHGHPFHAVSVGCAVGERPVLGAVAAGGVLYVIASGAPDFEVSSGFAGLGETADQLLVVGDLGDLFLVQGRREAPGRAVEIRVRVGDRDEDRQLVRRDPDRERRRLRGDGDVAAPEDAHTVVLLLPAGTSAHMEAGIASGLGKHLVLIGEPAKPETLYLIFDECFSSVGAFLETI